MTVRYGFDFIINNENNKLGKGSKKKYGEKYGLLPNPPRTPPPWFGLFYKKYKISTCFLATLKPF